MKRLLMLCGLMLTAPALFAQAVLVFDNNSEDAVAQTACTNLGYTCTVADSANFVTELTGGTWDLVVMDLPSTGPTGDWQTPLAAYITGGGKAIQTGWNNADFTALASVYEVTLSGDHDAIAFYQWNGSTLFSDPNTVPTTMAVVDDTWGSNGFYLTVQPAGSGIAAAGFSAAPADGQAASVIGNSGNTIFNGFLFDDFYPADTDTSGKDDIVEYLENQMLLLIAGSEPAESRATFLVTKAYTDGNTTPVDVTLTCNNGLPLVNTFTISPGNPVDFVLTDFTSGLADCTVTETSVPDGYVPSYDNGTAITGVSCEFTDITAAAFSCAITNSAEPGTFTVNKVWEVNDENGGDDVDRVAEITIICDAEIEGGYQHPQMPGSLPPLYDEWMLDGTIIGDGSLVATVDTSMGPATCEAEETSEQSGVDSTDDCGPREIGAGETSECTITNTVFFEGIPSLNQYGLAIMALLMLGMGMVGFRRFA
jgi:hypothetical protein